MSKKITIIHGNDGSDVRIGKMCRSLSTADFEVHFIGWDRRPGQENRSIDLGDANAHIMQLATANGRATIVGQLKFFWFALGVLWRVQTRVLCVVNEDLASMFVPFRWTLYSWLVCDMFDPFADRHSNKRMPFRLVARAVSLVSRMSCDRLIATDDNRRERLGRFAKKAIVIENFPEDPGDEYSKTLPTGETKIYVAGSLSKQRGIEAILAAAEAVHDVRILSAGWVYDDYANKQFVTHPKVDYRGVVTLKESLKLASECDAVFCFYSPQTTNNLNASPNKIFDALSVGRPTIINSETRIADWVEAQGYGYQCGYHDREILAAIVSALPIARQELPQKIAKWRTDFCKKYSWSKMETRLVQFYNALGN